MLNLWMFPIDYKGMLLLVWYRISSHSSAVLFFATLFMRFYSLVIHFQFHAMLMSSNLDVTTWLPDQMECKTFFFFVDLLMLPTRWRVHIHSVSSFHDNYEYRHSLWFLSVLPHFCEIVSHNHISPDELCMNMTVNFYLLAYCKLLTVKVPDSVKILKHGLRRLE